MRHLCEYEISVLRRINLRDFPDDPGAAWWQAIETLSVSGYITASKLTDKGRAALAQAQEGEG